MQVQQAYGPVEFGQMGKPNLIAAAAAASDKVTCRYYILANKTSNNSQ